MLKTLKKHLKINIKKLPLEHDDTTIGTFSLYIHDTKTSQSHSTINTYLSIMFFYVIFWKVAHLERSQSVLRHSLGLVRKNNWVHFLMDSISSPQWVFSTSSESDDVYFIRLLWMGLLFKYVQDYKCPFLYKERE